MPLCRELSETCHWSCANSQLKAVHKWWETIIYSPFARDRGMGRAPESGGKYHFIEVLFTPFPSRVNKQDSVDVVVLVWGPQLQLLQNPCAGDYSPLALKVLGSLAGERALGGAGLQVWAGVSSNTSFMWEKAMGRNNRKKQAARKSSLQAGTAYTQPRASEPLP